MLISLSGRSFFALSSDYKKIMLDEFYYLSKYINLSYVDFLIMPIFERRYLINKLNDEFMAKLEQQQKNKK